MFAEIGNIDLGSLGPSCHVEVQMYTSHRKLFALLDLVGKTPILGLSMPWIAPTLDCTGGSPRTDMVKNQPFNDHHRRLDTANPGTPHWACQGAVGGHPSAVGILFLQLGVQGLEVGILRREVVIQAAW